MHNSWGWLLLGWATAHALEHSYMLARYLELLRELERLGVRNVSAQGLPGILGRDGWLAQDRAIRDSFFDSLPLLTTANRIDIHFWWNTGELALLVMASHGFLSAKLRYMQLGVTDTARPHAVGNILGVAAALSLLAGLIHLSVTLQHFEKWWGYGAFFLVAGLVQAAYSVALLRRPGRSLLLAGIGGNLAIIVLWALTRTVGIPLFGPEAGEVEATGALDLTAKVVELLLIVLLVLLQRRSSYARPDERP